jgi:hypothetical protein
VHGAAHTGRAEVGVAKAYGFGTIGAQSHRDPTACAMGPFSAGVGGTPPVPTTRMVTVTLDWHHRPKPREVAGLGGKPEPIRN